MDPFRRRRVEDIFLAAVELEPGAQAAFVANACAADADLRHEVEDLLRADSEATSFLQVLGPQVSPRQWMVQALAEAADGPVGPVGRIPDGTLLAGRFRVHRFLAAGGMGEVYEAQDTVLGERVAIKTIAPRIAGSARAMERFQREVNLARKVTHSSVCRIYDIFCHGPDNGRDPDLVFLSMELLEGETLQARLERLGRLTPEAALHITRQLVDGLDAAHRAGIVHRDLKAANVLLVPDGVQDRAVVTDFGLARRQAVVEAAEEASGSALTETGLMLGTPATMAPEQVTGGEITAATDIYALGVLLYQMVTGRLPFEAETQQEAIYKRLHAKPTPPRAHVADLDRRWQRVILKCLERRPQDRFATVREVFQGLGSQSFRPFGSSLIGSILRPALSSRRSQALAVVVLVCVSALIFFLTRAERGPDLVLRGTAEGDVPTAVVARRSVAVIGFESLSGESSSGERGAEWLSTALSEMLSMELARGHELRVVPGETVARMRLDLELPSASSPAADTLARIRAYLGTDWVILGSYFLSHSKGSGALSGQAAGDVVRLDLRLEEVSTGRTLILLTESGEVGDLLGLVDRVGRQLRQRLGVHDPVDAEVGALTAATPATQLYVQGLAELRRFDVSGARDALVEAARLDPSSALIQTALAEAWTTLGFETRAAQAAETALELAEGLSRDQRLRIEGRAFEARKDWPRAIETYRVLFGFFPDHLEDGLRLASAQTAGGRAQEALETLVSLKELSAPSGDDPRIELEEATTALALGEYPRALRAAGRARERSLELGARWLSARSSYLEGNALLRLREYGGVVDRARVASEIYEQLGDQRGMADTLNLRANVAYFERRLDDAEALYLEALEIHRRLSSRAGVMTLSNNLANVRLLGGDLDGARRLYDRSLTIAREISHADGEARGLYNLGLLAWRQNDLSGARDFYRQALEITRRTGDRRRMAQSLNNLGLVLRRLGDLDGAEGAYVESLELAKRSGDPTSIARCLGNLGFLRLRRGQPNAAGRDFEEAWKGLLDVDEPSVRATLAHGRGEVAVARGELESAAEHLRTALELEQESRDEAGVLALRNALANLDLLNGSSASALAAARQIALDAAVSEYLDQELAARILTVEAALVERDWASARFALEQATKIASTTEDAELAFRVALSRSRLQRLEGDYSGARRGLEPTLIRAQAAGLGSFGFEGRLELLRIEQGAGSDVRERLRDLAQKAESYGFLRLAGEARRAASPKSGIETARRDS